MKDKIGVGWGIDLSDGGVVILLLEVLFYEVLIIGFYRYYGFCSYIINLWEVVLFVVLE